MDERQLTCYRDGATARRSTLRGARVDMARHRDDRQNYNSVEQAVAYLEPRIDRVEACLRYYADSDQEIDERIDRSRAITERERLSGAAAAGAGLRGHMRLEEPWLTRSRTASSSVISARGIFIAKLSNRCRTQYPQSSVSSGFLAVVGCCADSLWRLGLSRGLGGWLDVGGLPAKTGRRGGSPRCALSACDMSCEDLLRGLPLCLAAAPPAADLLRHGPVLGDDLLGLLGVTGVPSVSQITWACHDP